MGLNRVWTHEEEDYLEKNWGSMAIPSLAKALHRSDVAIKIRASRLKLGPVLEAGNYITLNQLIIAVTGNTECSYQLISWVEKRGLPIHTRRVLQNTFRVVYLDEFWSWAKKNRSFIDFSKMEPLALGAEPDWVAEQRRKDAGSFYLQQKRPWTSEEDHKLMDLLRLHKFTWPEISERMGRSEGSIQRRCNDLGIKERPVKAGPRTDRPWDEWAYKILADGIRGGDSYAAIGRCIGKSEKAVRGKVYTVYLTENADKVREMLGSGKWGMGAPEPTVKQALFLSHHRESTRRELASLAAILKRRAISLGWDPYWQRKMCQHWDDLEGCTVGCENCDVCTEFKRMEPQYCSRCGRDFFERKQNRFCPACRTARKKQAQRKWARLNARR